MPFDIKSLIQQHRGRNYDLHRAHVNPQWARALKIIGFDRVYERALGAHFWDAHGTRYLDFQAGYAVHNVGRNHPAVKQALKDFLELDYATLLAFDAPLLAGILAGELKKRMPQPSSPDRALEYVFFTNSGTEGVEAAIKFAKCATSRPAMLFASKAFHGLSSGALSVNGDPHFREGFGPFMPECREIPFNDLATLEKALAANDVAGFIVEPIQGKGVNIPAPDYLREAAALCRGHGTLFIADEIQTGCGRTGKFLAIEHENAGAGRVEPDIVILSKALSGGYVPVGAVLTRKAVWEQVFSSLQRAIVHSSTFHQGSLAMVAALAVLQVIDEEKLTERAERMGRMLLDGLNAMRPRFELIKDIRGRGLMIGVEFGPPAMRGPRSIALRGAWSLIHAMDGDLFPQAIVIPLLDDHHILTQVAGHEMDVVKLIPPLVIDEEDVRWFLSAFEQVMQKLHQFPGPVWELMKKLGKHAVTSRGEIAREAIEV
jgi:ornithine--oxo-acid transaminase